MFKKKIFKYLIKNINILMAPTKTHRSCKVSKWYKPDDEKVPFNRKKTVARKTILRKNI